MRIDVYTKTVLTVIALALVWIGIAMTPIGTPVTAQTQQAVGTRVLIAGWIDSAGMQHMIPTSMPGIPVASHTVAATAEASASGVMQSLAPATTAPAATVAPRSAPAPAPAAARVQCAATTQRGTRCSRLAEVGGAFCWQHKGR
jgi:hypothetical protein